MVAPVQPKDSPPGIDAKTSPRNGLLSVKSNQQVLAEEQARRDAAAPTITISNLAAYIDRCFEVAKNERTSAGVDERLMSAMRQRKGEYDPEKLGAIREQGGSEIFMLITEEKCAGAEAWISDVLMPSDGKPWGLEATPIPDLPDYMQKKVVTDTMMAVQNDFAAGRGVPSPDAVFEYAFNLRERYLEMMRKMAKEAAERMETRIDDQLSECKFMDVFYDFIKDIVTFGTGIIEGPVLRLHRGLRYGPGAIPFAFDSVRIEFDRVSPLDVYPSPGAMNPDDGYMIFRIRHNRRQIAGLKGLAGVNNAAIDRVLTQYGQTGFRKIEPTDSERQRLGDKTLLYQADDIIEGLKFKGCVSGRMLIEWGMTGAIDPLREYEIEALKYGEHVVRTQPNPDPLYRRKIYKGVYEPIMDSFWGRGVPHLMKDIQDMCNASARALADNEALAAGPQAVIDDINRLPHGEDVTNVYPRKIWQFVNNNTSSTQRKAVEFFTIDSKATEFLMIIEKFMAMADNRTRIPAYVYGSDDARGAGQTVGGLAMLMNSASRSIKKIIAGIDRDIIKPAITAMYNFNMLYDDDPSIKGDINVIAKGATALMIHEQRIGNIAAFLKDTASEPMIVDMERRANLRREQAQLLGIPVEKAVPPPEEMRQRIMAAATMPPEAPGPEGGKTAKKAP